MSYTIPCFSDAVYIFNGEAGLPHGDLDVSGLVQDHLHVLSRSDFARPRALG